MRKIVTLLCLLIIVLLNCKKTDKIVSDKKFAFVTNNASTFWNIAKKGIEKAEKEFNLKVDFRVPLTGQVSEQQKIIEDLISKGITGMAISPIDPKNMTDILNRAAEKMLLITHDSDAPDSKRIAYVGSNNYKAGYIAGKAMMEALPEGGDVIIFVGNLDAQNARDRKKGFEDAVKNENINILETRLDYTDHEKAKENVESALIAYPDIKGFLGLWNYNGPAIAAAVKSSNKKGKVKIVCFDEEEETLEAIQNGIIYATIVQKPFEFGYQSIKILYYLSENKKDIIPPDGIIDTGVMVVKKENLKEFWEKLKLLKK